MPSGWNRSRATAIAVTLLLHLVLAVWLLSLKQGTPPATAEIAEIEWIPPREPLPPSPPVQLVPFFSEAAAPPFILLPVPQAVTPPPAAFDFYGDSRAIVGALRGSPGRRGFEIAAPSDHKLKSKPDGPPPLFEQPLPRVGTTVTTPQGETILWVSDYCYISLSSTSLTMNAIHEGRQGVRTCSIPVGKREPRDDLFDHLESPPAGNAPGQQ